MYELIRVERERRTQHNDLAHNYMRRAITSEESRTGVNHLSGFG